MGWLCYLFVLLVVVLLSYLLCLPCWVLLVFYFVDLTLRLVIIVLWHYVSLFLDYY